MYLPAALLVPTVCHGQAGTILGPFLRVVPIRRAWSCGRVSLSGRWCSVFPGGGRCFRTEEVTEGNVADSDVLDVFVGKHRIDQAIWYKKESLIFAFEFKDNVCHCLCTSLEEWQALKMSRDSNSFPPLFLGFN